MSRMLRLRIGDSAYVCPEERAHQSCDDRSSFVSKEVPTTLSRSPSLCLAPVLAFIAIGLLCGCQNRQGGSSDNPGQVGTACPQGTLSSYTVTDASQVASLRDCHTIGSFRVERVDGLTVLDLPSLRSVGPITIAANPALRTIRVPMLQTIEGELYIHENPVLSEVEFPVLSSVGDDVAVRDNAALAAVRFPALQEARNFVIYGPALRTVTAPAVRSTRRIDVRDASTIDFSALRTTGAIALADTRLTELDLPRLEEVQGADNFSGFMINDANVRSVNLPRLQTVNGGLRIFGAASLTSLAAPRLRSCRVSVSSTGLRSLDLPSLESSSHFYISRNPSLSELRLPSLRNVDRLVIRDNRRLVSPVRVHASLRAEPELTEICNNADGSRCRRPEWPTD